MLGRRSPQLGFFDARSLPHNIPKDSFYYRMGAVWDRLFDDDDLAPMYSPENGRPSLPPSMMCGVLLLQFYDDVSDAEAVERAMFDQRWKVALGLPLDYRGFDSSSLSVFRKRLLDNGKESYAFERLLAVGREAGFIPAKVTLIVDTVAVKGAGAVQDSYTLLRKGIRKLLKAMGYDLPGKRQGMGERAKELVAAYLDRDKKADIDWSDPEKRGEQLKVLVADVKSALELAAEQTEEEEVRAAGWLLTKIWGDDIEEGEEGEPRIAEGTAADRIVSVTDPDMRHGRKSKSRKFDGSKVRVMTEASSELIADMGELAASQGDGKGLEPALSRVEERLGVQVEGVIGDTAFGTGENLAACANHAGHPIDLVAPVGQAPERWVGKAEFRIDLEAKKAICPEGQEAEGRQGRDEKKRPILKFEFSRCRCEQCPLFAKCVRSKTKGRVVMTHHFESHLQRARQRQETPEFKAVYRGRSAVERKLAELVEHGLRATRYLGEKKRRLQRLWLGAAVNLKRLFKLSEERKKDLLAALGALSKGQMAAKPA